MEIEYKYVQSFTEFHLVYEFLMGVIMVLAEVKK